MHLTDPMRSIVDCGIILAVAVVVTWLWWRE